jgi:hypothetical protein
MAVTEKVGSRGHRLAPSDEAAAAADGDAKKLY